MGVNLTLQEIATYGFCSLQHELRYRRGFPWFPATYEVVTAQAWRDAAAHMLLGRMGPPSGRKGATKAAQDELIRTFDVAAAKLLKQKSGVFNAASHRTDASLGLKLLDLETIKQGRDRVLGVNVPYTVAVGDVSVTGTIDAVYEYMWESPSPYKVFMTEGQIDDPLQDLVNWGSLRRGFALRTVHDGSRYMQNVRFLQFDVLRGKTVSQFVLADPLAKLEFEALVEGAAKGIASRTVIPTQAPVKCSHCPYKPVCKPTLANGSAPILEAAKAKVIELANKSPFRSPS